MVYGSAAYAVAIGKFPLAMVLGDVHDEVELVVGNHCHHVFPVAILLVRPCHSSCFYSVFVKELCRAFTCAYCVALADESAGSIEHGYLLLCSTRGNHDSLVLRRYLVAGSNKRVQQSLLVGVAHTSHLASRAHIHTQNWVGIL